MAVYVDPLLSCAKSRRWPWPEACHLIADSASELHKFAAKLGLSHKWFQGGNRRLPHYDLTAGKRKQAVKMGAVEISREEIVRQVKKYRCLVDKILEG